MRALGTRKGVCRAPIIIGTISCAFAVCLVPPQSPAGCTDTDVDGFFLEDSCGTEPDCNDAAPTTHPFAPELCDGVDNDCNGQIDDDAACVNVCIAPEEIGDDIVISPLLPLAAGYYPFHAWNGQEYLYGWTRDVGNTERIATVRLSAEGVEEGTFTDHSEPGSMARGGTLVWTGSEYGLAWFHFDNGLYSIEFMRLDSDGNKIGNQLQLTQKPDPAAWPRLVWTGWEYGLVWFQEIGGVEEVMFARIDASGQRIGQNISLTPGVISWDPKVVWNGSGYGIAWTRDPFGPAPSIRFRLFDATGTPAGEEIEVTSAEGRRIGHLAWTGSEYGLAFFSERDGGDWEIYLARIGSDGVEIGQEQRMTFAPGDSFLPSLVWNGAEYGLLWQDDRTGNEELYFRTVDPGGAIGAEVQITDAVLDSSRGKLVWTGTEYSVSWEDSRDFGPEVYFTRIGCDCSADADDDAVSVCNDCDENQAAVFPDAPQLCDGLNNDCKHPSWPQLEATNEFDDDGDGMTECLGDCDDSASTIFAGASEINDGVDNQCPGDPGFGSVDEIAADVIFTQPDTFTWPAQAGATMYQVARSSFADFSADCTLFETADTFHVDPAIPPLGSVDHYLVRPLAPNPGSWGQDAAGAERNPTCP